MFMCFSQMRTGVCLCASARCRLKCAGSTAVQQRGNQSKRSKDFHLKGMARNWLRLSYMCHNRSTAEAPRARPACTDKYICKHIYMNMYIYVYAYIDNRCKPTAMCVIVSVHIHRCWGRGTATRGDVSREGSGLRSWNVWFKIWGIGVKILCFKLQCDDVGFQVQRVGLEL